MIEFSRVSKVFPDPHGGEVTAVQGLDLEVREGEVHGLIGSSGCGKTTTLRMVNRLLQPSGGHVSLGGDDVSTLDVYQLRRRIGYVIQSGGLFPHMNVAKNVGIMCTLQGWSGEATRKRVDELLDLVNLRPGEFRDRFPGELSGGQGQRVGVARALALDPDYVLMDEPFSALDPITRTQLQDEFLQLLAQVNKTVLIVTHDLDEAFRVSNRVSIMDKGELIQTGTADELISQPASPFVESFVAKHGRGAGE